MKISVYTILYYDLNFYEDIIKYIYDIVDEIIIIDGPYSYSVDTLKKFNLFYDENNKPSKLNEIINTYSKVKYKYAICDNEEEKRMMGYNMCSNDLVLLIDSDEFLNINIEKLNDFINNTNKFVCCTDIYNMCDYNINFNKLTQKYILFKKNRISALEHLNYTWLIGCKQTEVNVDYMMSSAFGTMYHQTLCRNKQNNIIKFIFYILLYRKNNNQPFNLIDNVENDILFNYLNVNEILDIFVHLNINRINIPSVSDNNLLEIINDNEYISNLKKYNNLSEFHFLKEMKCLKNIEVCFRLHNTNTTNNIITVFFENVKSVNIKIYNIYLNESYKINSSIFQNILDNKIEIVNNNNGNECYIIIEINCIETMEDNLVFTVKNIL